MYKNLAILVQITLSKASASKTPTLQYTNIHKLYVRFWNFYPAEVSVVDSDVIRPVDFVRTAYFLY